MAEPRDKSSMRIRDEWNPDKSAFQSDDGKFDGKGVGGTSAGGGSADLDDPTNLRREVKLQLLGKQLVSTLYMLVRNVKIHSPDNAIFLKPLDTLREAMNRVIAQEKSLNLQAADTHVYLNNTRLRFDFTALETVNYLTKEFESRDIGGFSTQRPVTTKEIRDFLHLFSSHFVGSAPEEGAEGRELPSMRLARYAQVKELLDKLHEAPDLDEQIDRKKYLMTVYSRSVFFMRKYFEKVQNNDFSIPFAKAARLVQDIVDLSKDQRTHFLGVTTCRSDTDYLPYHSVNTALLSVVFGGELGLDKKQLHDLGMAALFAQIGLLDIPDNVLHRPAGLSDEERRDVDLFPLRSAKKILFARGLDRTTMMRIVAAYESKVDFAIPRRGADGEIELVMPKVGLGVFGRIIAICECYDALTSKRPFREPYGPEIALALMFHQIKYRFDPVLLRVFMKVMAVQPIRILEEGERSLRIG